MIIHGHMGYKLIAEGGGVGWGVPRGRVLAPTGSLLVASEAGEIILGENRRKRA
jgi:hypothetical protein